MRNIETFPSKHMYPYLSLAERKVAEFYLNIDRMRWLVWLKWLIFINFSAQLMVSLAIWVKLIFPHLVTRIGWMINIFGPHHQNCWLRSAPHQLKIAHLPADKSLTTITVKARHSHSSAVSESWSDLGPFKGGLPIIKMERAG